MLYVGKKRRSSKGRSRRNSSFEGYVELTRKGFGFISTQHGEYYISEADLNGAMHRDRVVASPVTTGGKGKAARVIRVLERATSSYVGRYSKLGPLGVVVPKDRRMFHDGFVDDTHSLKAQAGDWVVATILSYPDRHRAMEVVITEIIESETESLPIDIIIAEHGLSTEFTTATKLEAKELFDSEKPIDCKAEERKGLRGEYVFTIDPSDARDFDDAISIKYRDSKYHLSVHIADVSAYVAWDSAIDCDAKKRSVSCYLPDRVIPMLPRELSNHLCSLMPGEDRRAFTVEMVLDDDAKLLSSSFYRSAIHSFRKLSYDQALAVLEDREGEYPDDLRDEEIEALFNLDSLAQRLSQVRRVRGGLDFDTIEAKLVLDDEGKPIDLIVRESTRATQMIEEAMILTNETVASFMKGRKSPMVYRVHEEPDASALDGLHDILSEFGYQLPADAQVSSYTYQQILRAAQGRPEDKYVSNLLLRTLKQAYYSPEAEGHFGLASQFYCHFTSPIRRYPDLMVHRLLAQELKLKPAIPGENISEMIGEIAMLSERSSEGERAAESAEREALKLKMTEYMKDQVGEEFAGIITNVANFGFFVTLDNSADGLVHVKSLRGDTWSYYPHKHMLEGAISKRRFRLGQAVQVRLIRVNVQEGLLDFELAEDLDY